MALLMLLPSSELFLREWVRPHLLQKTWQSTELKSIMDAGALKSWERFEENGLECFSLFGKRHTRTAERSFTPVAVSDCMKIIAAIDHWNKKGLLKTETGCIFNQSIAVIFANFLKVDVFFLQLRCATVVWLHLYLSLAVYTPCWIN